MSDRLRELTVGRAFGIAGVAIGAIAVAFAVAGILALNALADARRNLVDRTDPARASAAQLTIALVDQETGLRGYIITGQRSFLTPYRDGQRREQQADARLRSLVTDGPGRRLVADAERAVRAWRDSYVVPTTAAVAAGRAAPRSPAALTAGRRLFDRIRLNTDRLTVRLRIQRDAAREQLRSNAQTVNVVFYSFGGLLLLVLVATAVALKRTITDPIGRLSRQARIVAAGRFDQQVGSEGLADTRQLGEDIEALRRRVLDELESVEAANADLARSNAELEQFAYVASHDLQEPLRKVASFTQLLQRRYGDQLDERADQYIEFAVDGAQRMQVLINDLLAFSRVGRLRDEEVTVSLEDVLADACKQLAASIEARDAQVTHDPLPTISGERALLTLVLQNLIGNAIKFTPPDRRPEVHVGHTRIGDMHELRVTDNGIGIDAEYADRIFVIFQRLHPKADYPGTGIGLAMCRKIVEHHGGEIRLDVDAPGAGSTIAFTLPALPDDHEHQEQSP